MQLTYLSQKTSWSLERIIQSLVDKKGKIEDAISNVTEREIRILNSYCGKSRLDREHRR